MSDNITPDTIKTAATLWQRLVDDGTIKPRSYDEDLVALLKSVLPGSGTLLNRIEAAEWTPRDLLRAMSPALDSFAGLLRDLLSLYTNISASHSTKDNLTICYEFDEGDGFDQSLTQFRSAVAKLERAQTARGTFVLSPQRWEYPSAAKQSYENNEFQTVRAVAEDSWDFTLPPPPKADNEIVARGVSLVYAVLNASCDTLRNYGATMHAVGNNSALRSRRTTKASNHLQLYYDFTDFFPEQVIVKLRSDVESLESNPLLNARNWLSNIEKWCSSFWGDEVCDAESALLSVLSLPMWGKRHELYSAWVVCVIAKSFEDQRLRFDVVNGRLSFPFKATRIASFEDRNGPVELWTEVRSAASGKLAHGRKRGVQPDYRFLRPGQAPSDTEMAIEVKHYRQAAASRHGDTARDYARALPRARVAVVAHGPIGKTAMNRVESADQSRVSFNENVRSLVSTESDALIAEMTDIFPPASLEVQGVEVVQSAVDEVQIRLIAQQNSDHDIVLHRNSSITAIKTSKQAEVVLEILCHPERRHTIDGARLLISITFANGEKRIFEPSAPNDSTRWHVGTLRPTSFIATTETMERSE